MTKGGMVEEMKDGYITIPEISEKTGIPESTARRYLEQHNHSLRTKKSGRGAWLLKEEDLPLIQTIRTCYEQKMSVVEVENYLLESGQPLTITIDGNQEKTITPAQAFMQLVDEIKYLQSEVSDSKKQLAAAYGEIADLKRRQDEELEKQTVVIGTIASEMKSMSEGLSRLERGQLERQKEQEKGFWSKLFGR